jgi:hypothetical protein
MTAETNYAETTTTVTPRQPLILAPPATASLPHYHQPVTTGIVVNTATESNVSNLIQTSRVCSKSYTKIPEVVNEAQRVKIEVVDLAPVAVTPVVPVSGSNNSTVTGRTMTGHHHHHSHHQHSNGGGGSGVSTPSTARRINKPHRSSKSDLAMQNNKASQENVNNGGADGSFSLPMSKSAIVSAQDKASYGRMTRSSISRQNSKDSVMSESSPPESPFHRRVGSTRDENVFNRLTSETKQSPMPES